MFTNSKLNYMLTSEQIPACGRSIIAGEEPIPIFLVGDPVCPLMPYLMKEYANGDSTQQEQYFEYRFFSGRNVLKCAFSHLKARFDALN